MSGTGHEIADILGDSAKKIGPALAEDFSGAYKNTLNDTADGLKNNAKRVVDQDADTAKNISGIKPEDDVHNVHGGSSAAQKPAEDGGDAATGSLKNRLSAILDPKEDEFPESDFQGKGDFGASVQDRKDFAASYANYKDDRDYIQGMKDEDEIAGSVARIPNADLAAIRGYTGGDFYLEMNKAMREGDPAGLKTYDAHIKTLTSGLKQLNPVKDTVTRGMGVGEESMGAFLDKYKPGSDVTESHFLSAGSGNHFMGNVKFTIDSVSGRSVKFVSRNPKENEVIFLPGSTFHVVSQEPQGKYGYHIHMRQTS